MYDLAIIGAGPIGLFIGSKVAKMGYDVIILEEHSDIGIPSHCSGLFSTHIFEIVGNKGILHPVKRAKIISPAGHILRFGNDKIRGYVVDRVEFDRSLARDAIHSGVELHLKEKVKKVKNGKLNTTQNEYHSRIIVGADGINSIVRYSMGVHAPHIIGATQVLAKYEYKDEESVTIFVGESVAPGFFAWNVPFIDGLIKIGLASHKNSWQYLKTIVDKMGVQPLSISGGGIPMGTVKKTYGDGMLIVGDAAGQVKATSGGGVYPGLRAAICAIYTIQSALEKGNYSSDKMKEYENCWKKSIGRELKNAAYLHRIYSTMKDDDFNNLISDLDDKKIIELINRYGDIDYPSRVAWRIFRRKPGIIRYTNIATKYALSRK